MITAESLREIARYHLDTAKFHSDPERMRFHVTAADTLDAIADMLERQPAISPELIRDVATAYAFKALQFQLAAVTAERDELKLQLENRE